MANDERETRVNGDTLIEVISSDYDLNYLASMLSSFKPEHHKASLLFLRIVFTSLGTSPQKQQEFYATPIIANLIPKVFQGFIDFLCSKHKDCVGELLSNLSPKCPLSN